MQDDVERIVRGLSKAQRAALCNASSASLGSLSPSRLKAHPSTCRALADRGLFWVGSDRWTGRIEYACTPLGLRVRSSLLSSTQGE